MWRSSSAGEQEMAQLWQDNLRLRGLVWGDECGVWAVPTLVIQVMDGHVIALSSVPAMGRTAQHVPMS
jgi:hypothetical protein